MLKTRACDDRILNPGSHSSGFNDLPLSYPTFLFIQRFNQHNPEDSQELNHPTQTGDQEIEIN